MLRCDKCKKEIVNLKDRENERKRIERRIDGFLTDADIKRIRQKLELTQEGMAKKLGVAPKTFARYENLSVRRSKCMDQLLRIFKKHPEMLSSQ
jgi:putative zinc finger/helix-turn-helix YgiT family protein